MPSSPVIRKTIQTFLDEHFTIMARSLYNNEHTFVFKYLFLVDMDVTRCNDPFWYKVVLCREILICKDSTWRDLVANTLGKGIIYELGEFSCTPLDSEERLKWCKCIFIYIYIHFSSNKLQRLVYLIMMWMECHVTFYCIIQFIIIYRYQR